MEEIVIDEEKVLSKEEFFENEVKKAQRLQRAAFRKGCFLLFLLVVIEYFLFPNWGYLGLIAEGIIFFLGLILVFYFIWAPEDVGWGSQPREGYAKALLKGNVLKGFINCPAGKAYTKDWRVVDERHPDAMPQPFSILGTYIIPSWPFTKVYWEKAEWRRYYPSQAKVALKRVLLKEFSLLPYPHFIEVLEAEDKNRLGINLKANVVTKITNPKKALFGQSTTYLDIFAPLFQGALVRFISQTSFQEMIKNKENLGKVLLEQLEDPTGAYSSLVLMIENVYGVKIESISILDIIGSDKDEQEAIKAKALAGLRRDAALIDADAASRADAITTMGAVLRSMAQFTAERKSDSVDQQAEYDAAENKLVLELKNNPETFFIKYGQLFNECTDIVKRRMSLKEGSLVDVRTSSGSAKSEKLNPLDMLIALNTLNNRSQGRVKSTKVEDDEG